MAKYADISNLIVADADEAKRKLGILAEHCEREGRDIAEIEKTVQGGFLDPLGDTDGFLTVAEAYSAAGIEHIHLRAATPDPAAFVSEFGEKVAPRLADIG